MYYLIKGKNNEIIIFDFILIHLYLVWLPCKYYVINIMFTIQMHWFYIVYYYKLLTGRLKSNNKVDVSTMFCNYLIILFSFQNHKYFCLWWKFERI